MAYELLDQGMAGVGLGGMFAPDAVIAAGKPDVLGKPQNGGSGMQRSQVAPSMLPVYDACERSADPVTCWGHNVLSKPFLGRPFQAEWRAWVAQQIAAQGAAPMVPYQQNVAPEEPADNTMLYVGVGAAALVAIGAAVVLGKKGKR